MIVKIDKSLVSQFLFMTSSKEFGATRRYYVSRPSTGRRMIIVCRDDLELYNLGGMVVDANVGYESPWPGFTRKEWEHKTHTKLTIYRLARRRHYDRTLYEILIGAPEV